jgi:potassium voltage-gated channel Eag-related subfamily H protein 8
LSILTTCFVYFLAYIFAKDSDTGPDEIYYQFLKHLPPECLDLLLEIFNKIWVSGKFPNTWKNALVIPIPKPEKIQLTL